MSGSRQGPPTGWYDTGRKKSDGSPIYEKIKSHGPAQGSPPVDSQTPMNDYTIPDEPPIEEPPPEDVTPPPLSDSDIPPDDDVPPDPLDPSQQGVHNGRISSSKTYPNQEKVEELKYFIVEQLSEHRNITRIRETAIDTYSVPFENGDRAEVSFTKNGQVDIDFHSEDGEGVETTTCSPEDAHDVLSKLADHNGEDDGARYAMMQAIVAQMAYKSASRLWRQRRARKRREKQSRREALSQPSRRLSRVVDMMFPRI